MTSVPPPFFEHAPLAGLFVLLASGVVNVLTALPVVYADVLS
jgi:hypothetical protein